MLVLKEFNVNDKEKEYAYLKTLPSDENGFENKYHNISLEEFENNVVDALLKESQGIDLQPGYVRQTLYFLWDDDQIVGLFKFRHYLNDYLRNGAGHIGYGISSKYRGKGYGTKGLKLLIELVKDSIEEDELYLSVHRDNPASLKVQINNGAYIHHSDEKEHYTRIKVR